MIKTVYLIVRPDGGVRCAQRPRIASDEVAVKVTLNFPRGWGRVIHEMNVDMPDVPAVSDVDVSAPERPTDIEAEAGR